MDTRDAIAERVFIVPGFAGAPGHALAAALLDAGEIIRAEWIDGLADHTDQGDAVRSLMAQGALQYPYLGDPAEVAVVGTVLQLNVLEEGAEGFHLPERWRGAWKTKKDGRRYAVIPFRHRTPATEAGGSTSGRRRATMPSLVAALAAGLQEGDRLIGFGDQYKQSKSYTYYRAGGMDVPEALGASYTWASSPYEGMIHSSRPTPGGGSQTEGYTTFRTMMEDSAGWYMPPRPGYHLAAQALERAAGRIQDLLDTAAAVDAAAALADAAKELFE